MRAVVTRVTEASVVVDGETVGAIGGGFLVLLGIAATDTMAQVELLVDRVCGLRIFADENGKMNRNLDAVGGSLLIISQFTLYADCSSRRPGFTAAARPDVAIPLYNGFLSACKDRGFPVESGRFGANMQVYSQNDGPVTIILDTAVI